MPADVDEAVQPGENADAYVRRVSEEKGRTIAGRVPSRVVLAADTTVVVDGTMLGKPTDDEHAKQMLRMLSGRSHQVLTAVTVCRGGNGAAPVTMTDVAVTDVEFAALTEFEIDWYVATREPHDKAGAYAIQGYASRFVTRINGSYSNVVGLPVALTYEMLKAVGQVI